MTQQEKVTTLAVLSVPCCIDVLFWLTLIVNPKNVMYLIVGIYIASWIAAIFGLCIDHDVRNAEKSSEKLAGVREFFGAVVLLNIFGVLYLIGAGGNSMR